MVYLWGCSSVGGARPAQLFMTDDAIVVRLQLRLESIYLLLLNRTLVWLCLELIRLVHWLLVPNRSNAITFLLVVINGIRNVTR